MDGKICFYFVWIVGIRAFQVTASEAQLTETKTLDAPPISLEVATLYLHCKDFSLDHLTAECTSTDLETPRQVFHGKRWCI